MNRGLAILLVLLAPCAVHAGKYDLHSYAAAGDVEGMAAVAKPKRINEFDKQGRTPLHHAAAAAQANAVEWLLARGAEVDLPNKKYRTTALHEIARSVSRDRSAIRSTVAALARAGADPGLKDAYGDDALTAAARVGNGAAVKALLAEFPDRISTESMETALGIARENGEYEVINALEAHGAQSGSGVRQGILNAAEQGNFAVLPGIVGAGADLEARDEDGATPLILAAKGGHDAVVRFLLEAGSNVAAARHDGQQALHLAAYGGHVSAIDMLLDAGADVNGMSGEFGTPVNRAAERERVDVVEHLLARGAIPASIEASDETAFGSGLAWRMYATHNEDRIDPEDFARSWSESDRLLQLAREKMSVRREEQVALRKKEARSDMIVEGAALAIGTAMVAEMQKLQQAQIEANQRQFTQIAALKDATSYDDYHSRLALYERVMIQPATHEPYQLDFAYTPYANTESVLGLDVIISEFDRRIALVDKLLAEKGGT